MHITYEGHPALVRKEFFYCKAGAYKHTWRTGWVVEVDGAIVLGHRLNYNTCDGAARNEFPPFPTRKGLLESLRDD